MSDWGSEIITNPHYISKSLDELIDSLFPEKQEN